MSVERSVETIAAGVRLIVLDVDGVLTDGGLYYGPDGQMMKRFNVKDGLGIKMAQAVGIEVAVITGLDSPAVKARVEELGIARYHAGHTRKLPLLDGMCADLGLTYAQVAYVGDDWVDASIMTRVGLPMCPADALPEICDLALWRASRRGGDGAVREAIAFILKAQGKSEAIWREWTQ